MKKTHFILCLLFAVIANTGSLIAQDKLSDGLYAKFTTAKGEIIVQLTPEKTPMTVANFVGLTEGNFEVLGKKIEKPFYNGLKFHRVIANFMIQGGDPDGNGSGGPGYRFYDETTPELRHEGPGVLSMANSGPATNGSQFFITHVATPWLDGKHTVFGRVVKGQDVVNAITQDDVMTKVEIIRIGKEAKNFNATKTFKETYDKIKAEEDAKEAELQKVANMSQDEYKSFLLEKVKKQYPKAQQTESGLVYVIENPGNGEKITAGKKLSVHYTGKFLNGTKFDSSVDRGQPMDFEFKAQRMIPGFEEGLEMLSKGGKGIFIIPYFNAYGPQGRPGAIPPYSDLVFELEVIDAQ